jgi:hypothetical protein
MFYDIHRNWESKVTYALSTPLSQHLSLHGTTKYTGLMVRVLNSRLGLLHSNPSASTWTNSQQGIRLSVPRQTKPSITSGSVKWNQARLEVKQGSLQLQVQWYCLPQKQDAPFTGQPLSCISTACYQYGTTPTA